LWCFLIDGSRKLWYFLSDRNRKLWYFLSDRNRKCWYFLSDRNPKFWCFLSDRNRKFWCFLLDGKRPLLGLKNRWKFPKNLCWIPRRTKNVRNNDLDNTLDRNDWIFNRSLIVETIWAWDQLPKCLASWEPCFQIVLFSRC